LQYKIPQNVGIEDKIVGPFTLRQLIMLSVGGGTSYVLFSILSKIYDLNALEYIVIALPGLIAVAAALIKINDLSLTKFALLLIEFNIKPRKRVWDHRATPSFLYIPDSTDEKAEANKVVGQADKKNVNLEDLTHILDSHGFKDSADHPDIDEVQDEDLVTQAFFGRQPNETDNMYWRLHKHDRGKHLDLLAKLPSTSVKKKVDEPPVTPTQKNLNDDIGFDTVLAAPEAEEKNIPPDEAILPPQSEQIEPFHMDQSADVSPSVLPPEPKEEPLPKVNLDEKKPDAMDSSALPVKKKNRRRRKKKPSNIPLTSKTHIDTTHSKKPAVFIPKKTLKAKTKTDDLPPPPAPEQQNKHEGEFNLKELQRGEIEINLD